MIRKTYSDFTAVRANLFETFNRFTRSFLDIAIIASLAILIVSGCSPKPDSNRMREELAAIYAEALRNPVPYPHMNSGRVAWMIDKAQNLPPQGILTHRYYLSQE